MRGLSSRPSQSYSDSNTLKKDDNNMRKARRTEEVRCFAPIALRLCALARDSVVLLHVFSMRGLSTPAHGRLLIDASIK
jgi:hypothetical protein